MNTIEEQVNEESLKRFPIRHKENKKGTGEYDSNFPRRKAFVDGACFVLEIENKKMTTIRSEVYNIDCMEYMKTMPDKYFDILIADPPYRNMNENAPQKEMREHGNMKTFGNKPTSEMLKEFERVSKHQIIWGANNFDYPFKGFVAWDKKVRGSDRYSQVEIASISESLATTSKFVAISCYDKKGKIHPSQKPIALYEWLLLNYSQQGWKIFDPMMGSQSSRIAAYKMGFDYVGCELDKEYFDKGNERFKQETSQLSLF